MRNSVKTLLVIFVSVIFVCSFTLWANNSPSVADYKWIRNRDTESDVVDAFVTALRINHPAAYQMTDPSLKPRLDDWMNTHRPKKCVDEPWIFLKGYIIPANGVKQGWKVVFGCRIRGADFTLKINGIVIENLQVVDWKEVVEEEE